MKITSKFEFLKKDKMKLFFLLQIVFLFYSFSAFALKVNRIFIKGNQLVETSTIRSSLSLKEKGNYLSSLVKADVKNLFELGFFSDIEVRTRKISKNKINITYFFRERHLIQSVDFVGNKAIGLEELKEISKVKSLGFLNFNTLKQTFSEIKKKYKEQGYFLVDLSYKIIPLPKQKKAKLLIQIKENQRVLIKRVHFVGNRRIPSRTLKNFLATKEQNVTSFFGNSGVYDPKALERDLQLIEYYYRDQGYLQVQLGRPEISITPDREGIYIHISIKEGNRFRVGEVEFREDSIVSEAQVIQRLKIKTRKYFSLSVLHQDLQTIQNLYKEKGYAFAQAHPRIVPDQREDNVVHILFQVSKGSVYKVGHVEIKGNHKTKDKVILRQIFLKEGDRYQESKRQLSENLIRRLGFFEDVKLKLEKTKSNLLDLQVYLKERERMGEAHLGGGYNSLYKVFIKAGVKQDNFLGLGHSISLQLDVSRFQEIFNFNYSDPYFLDTNWNLGMNVFNMGQDLLNDYNAFSSSQNQRFLSYSQFNTGASLSLGRRFSNFLNLFMKYRLQNQSLSHESANLLSRSLLGGREGFIGSLFSGDSSEDSETTKNPIEERASRYVSFSDLYPLEEGEGVNSSLSGVIEYDRRNDRYMATEGYYGQLSLEYSGLGGDFDYTKIKTNFRYYKELFWKVVFRSNLNYGLVFSNKKGQKIPFTELFLIGGPNSLRGFTPFSVGVRRYSEKAFEYATRENYSNPESFAWRPYGGSQMFYWNLELQFPVLHFSGLHGVLFFDVGEASNKLSFNPFRELRANYGLGIRWRSPFGPIRLELGFPFRPRTQFGEKEMEFQFSMGPSF